MYTYPFVIAYVSMHIYIYMQCISYLKGGKQDNLWGNMLASSQHVLGSIVGKNQMPTPMMCSMPHAALEHSHDSSTLAGSSK
jgi:hypothetical protein